MVPGNGKVSRSSLSPRPTSQTLIVLSLPALQRSLESPQTRFVTRSVCPLSSFIGLFWARSQILIFLSSPAVAAILPQGDTFIVDTTPLWPVNTRTHLAS